MMMCRVFCVVLVLALLCCCSCVFASEEEEDEEVLPVNAECAGDGEKVGRWQLRGKSLWYNCTAEAGGLGSVICGMGVGNCEPEDVERRTKGVAKDGVFTINVSTFTPSAVKSWWERNVEKAVTAAIGAAKPPEVPRSPPDDKDSRDTSTPDSESPADAANSAGARSLAETPPGSAGESGPATRPEAGTPAARQEEASRDASTTNSKSPPAVVENSTDVPPPPPPATPGGAGANSAAGAAATTDPSAAASQASDSAPSAELQGPSHSTSAASAASESIPDPKPTEGSDHSSHDPPVELQEETAAAPPNQLSQTGEEGGAAEGAEEDTANTTTETDSSEGNNMAADMPAPLSSAPTTNVLEKSVGADACFHDTRLHALPLLVLAALTYGTLG
ncbi:putative serine-alanine-and proline-rich protein [Trypanosoma cruzi]|nr:putative serine-alanine-and proline-rich protein [Trypanosoma cruzi]